MNCSATVARQIAAKVERDLLPDYPNVDGVVALTHGTGCGMADSGEGYRDKADCDRAIELVMGSAVSAIWVTMEAIS